MKIDMINAPPHYTKGAIQFLDYLKQQLSQEGYFGFLEASVMKYMHRHKLKNKNIEGIIVGKAIYDGDINLEELAKEIDA